MNILYISPLWTALKGALYEGSEIIMGMPAFVHVLSKLVADGHHIDIIFLEDDITQQNRALHITIPWLQKTTIRIITICKYTGVRKPIGILRNWITVYRASKQATMERTYDFVYGHSELSEPANFVARRLGIPFGERRYGDSYDSLIQQKGLLYAILSRPDNFSSYRTKKAFMIGTNDGSHIDRVYKQCTGRKAPYPLYFWLNGVDVDSVNSSPKKVPKAYIFSVARIVESKGLLQCIDILKHSLHLKEDIDLIFAGSIDSPDYYQQVQDRITEYGIADHVQYVGVLGKADIASYAKQAVANLFFYTPCNLGNVFIETFSAGGIIVALNDGSLDSIVQNDVNGFLVSNPEEAASVISNMLHNQFLQESIRLRALERAPTVFTTWETRVQKEIDLIYSVVDGCHNA